MESFYFLDKALLSLNTKEHIRFKKFLSSPYFKNNHTNVKLLQTLYVHIKPYFKNHNCYKNFSWSEAIKKISDNSQVKNFESRIKSELLYYVLEFLAFESLCKNQILRNLSVLSELDTRALFDLYDRYNKLNIRSKENNDYNPEYDYYYFKIFQLDNQHNAKKGIAMDFIKEYKLLLEYFRKEEKKILSKFNDNPINS